MRIAQQLANVKKFILWRRTDKTPIDVSNQPIDATRAREWRYANTLIPYVNAERGLGLALGAIGGAFCIDLDGCVRNDGSLTPFAAEIVKAFAGAYMEVSQSGRGIHIIGVGDLPAGHKTRGNGVEIYTRNRYIALTGDRATGDARHACQNALTALHSRVFPPSPLSATTVAAETMQDDWRPVVARMLASPGGMVSAFRGCATARELWDADPAVLAERFPAGGPRRDGLPYDASAADQALCNRLAFWLERDLNAMREAFMASGLGLRRKCLTRPDYVQHTCVRAQSDCPETLSQWRARQPKITSVDTSVKPSVDHTGAAPLNAARPASARTDVPWINWVEWKDPGINTVPAIRSQRNIKAVLEAYGLQLSYDEFTGVMYANDVCLTDTTIARLWAAADAAGMKATHQYFKDIIPVMARNNSYHPVRDYLNGLKWDGESRLDTWMIKYLGANDDAAGLNRAYGRCHLLAAVRRIDEPGYKHDQLLVLLGAQGTGKSSAIKALCANKEWFTDSLEIGVEHKVVIEQTSGKWIIELAELAGMRKRDLDTVKAQLSRDTDTARLSYDRITTRRQRSFVMFASVNPSAGGVCRFLTDDTGNRRYWLVNTGTIDLEGLARDRDQLWAEAVARARGGELSTLPRELWSVSLAASESRRPVSAQQEIIEDKLAENPGLTFIPSAMIREWIGTDVNRSSDNWNIAEIMNRLGYDYCRSRVTGVVTRGYRKR